MKDYKMIQVVEETLHKEAFTIRARPNIYRRPRFEEDLKRNNNEKDFIEHNNLIEEALEKIKD